MILGKERPYRDKVVALTTMHGKERALARPFARFLEADILVPSDVNTDELGTFTGEIARTGSMLEVARAKVRLGMKRTGLRFGVASEGSYGPHPYVPFIPGGTEIIVFIDDDRGIEIRESQVVTRTNFDSYVFTPGEVLEPILRRMLFPSHCLTVRPSQQMADHCEAPLFKGLNELTAISRAVEACAGSSVDGKALIVPDMRAHCNPARMCAIRSVATKLVKRIACLCPACATPGFGIVDVARGLTCADCGSPTRLPVAEIHRCGTCSFEITKQLRRDDERASPGQCEYCNP